MALFFGLQYIHTVNIGDSGFLVIRDDAVLYHSPAQQRGFNTPYQLQNSGGETLNDAEVSTVASMTSVVQFGQGEFTDNCSCISLKHFAVRFIFLT